jgi:transposase
VNHVAIDLGSRESQICMRLPDGTIVEEWKHPTKKLPDIMKGWGPSRVILETSAEAFRIADAALAAGHQVRVVPATLVRALGVGDRGIKNDERDARNLSKASCQMDVPSVHIPTESSRRLKSMCGSREVLIESRTKLINNVRGWLRTQLWRIRPGATTTFPDRVRAHATMLRETLPTHIERALLVIVMMNDELKVADKELGKLAKEHPVCHRLMSVPGVGPITAVRFLAAIDDPTRFHNAHGVQSYLGLTPGENSSSQRQQRTGITKAGPAALRRSLIQGAWAAMHVRSTEPMVEWARRIADRRGKFVAVVALARKIAGILFALWRDGTTYRSQLSARPAPAA